MATKVDFNAIRSAIREKYKKVAHSIDGGFLYPTGKEGAEKLGYDPFLIHSAPKPLIEIFCGVGCPFSLGEIALGETVLDVGCGGGFDLFCSSRMVGLEGKAFGVDLSPEMIKKAQANLALAGVSNARVQVGSSEQLPFDEDTFEVVTSNGVLNLSLEKEKTYSEIWRVLKPGGRLQFADMVLKEELPPEEMSAKAWSH
jgi:SAM-dependent methyltransferase